MGVVWFGVVCFGLMCMVLCGVVSVIGFWYRVVSVIGYGMVCCSVV